MSSPRSPVVNSAAPAHPGARGALFWRKAARRRPAPAGPIFRVREEGAVGRLLIVCVLGLVAALPVSGTAPGRPPAADSIEALAARARESVVEVIGTLETSGDTSYGAGFAVSAPDLIVTNAHVLRGVKSAMVRTREGALLASVEVLHQDETVDLAALRVKGLRLPPLVLSPDSAPPVGARVFAIGHPRGYEYTFSDGIVSAVRSLTQGGPELIQATVPISPGSSGGPMLDLGGRVVGVCSLTLTEGQNINFAVPAREVARFLDEALEIERDLSRADSSSSGAETLARLVRKHRESGDLVRASQLVARALAAHPRSAPLLLEAAEVAWAKGSYKEVDALVAELTQVVPGCAPARQIKAALLAQDGRCDEAIGEARAALAGGLSEEQAGEAHAVLGECLGRLGRPAEALAQLDLALAAPRVAAVPDYHALRAFLLQSLGRGDEADREAVTALELSGWDPVAVAALRERDLPRLVEIESSRTEREGGAVIVRGVVRNRGPIPLGEINIAAEVRDPSGAVVATGAAKVIPARLAPWQTGAFRIALEGAPEAGGPATVRVVDFREAQ